MATWCVQSFFKFASLRAGLTKRSIPLDDDKHTVVSYFERGVRATDKASFVFVHGFGSSKEIFMPLIQNIPKGHHIIAFDLPGHGETIVSPETKFTIESFSAFIKAFLDKIAMEKPVYLIGLSLGGAAVCHFTSKHPSYVKIICLMTPLADKDAETELIREVRAGNTTAILPETTEQFRVLLQNLAVKRLRIPNFFLDGFMKIRLSMLDYQKKVLDCLLNEDTKTVNDYFESLRSIDQPVLILWGKQDKIYAVSGGTFYLNRLPHAKLITFDECGHSITIDKPSDAARNIVDFFQDNSNMSK